MKDLPIHSSQATSKCLAPSNSSSCKTNCGAGEQEGRPCHSFCSSDRAAPGGDKGGKGAGAHPAWAGCRLDSLDSLGSGQLGSLSGTSCQPPLPQLTFPPWAGPGGTWFCSLLCTQQPPDMEGGDLVRGQVGPLLQAHCTQAGAGHSVAMLHCDIPVSSCDESS